MKNTISIEMTQDEIQAFVQMKFLASAMYFALDARPVSSGRSWSSILDIVEPHLRMMERMLERNKMEELGGKVIQMFDKKTS